MYSFDLESADEIGILGNGLRSVQKLDANILSNDLLPPATVSTISSNVDENNTMNGSFACDHRFDVYNESTNILGSLFHAINFNISFILITFKENG
jgi:hypothetical protein